MLERGAILELSLNLSLSAIGLTGLAGGVS